VVPDPSNKKRKEKKRRKINRRKELKHTAEDTAMPINIIERIKS
jgi:hypothetical protein